MLHRGWQWLSVLTFALLFVVAFTVIVPYNMDEFLFYNTILCHWYPGNNIHGACDPFQLNVLNSGLILPLRSYFYVGSFPALYFFPILLVWNSPLAARMLGMVFLMAGGVIAARMFSFKAKFVVPALILTFPYLFQHLVDTGPVGIHIFFVFLLYVLLDRWCATQRWLTALSIALIVFLGIWTKPVFFWYAPGLTVVLLIHIVRHWEHLRVRRHLVTFLIQGGAALTLLLALLAVIFLSTAPHDPTVRPFLEQLFMSESYTWKEMLKGQWLSSPAWYALLHPLEATQRVFLVRPERVFSLLYSIIHYLSVPFVLLLLALFSRGYPRRQLLLPLALFAAFALTVLMVVRTKSAWSMHHVILSYPFLILAVLATVRCAVDACALVPRQWIRATLVAWATVFVEVNVCFFMLFHSQLYFYDNMPRKHVVQQIINTGSIPERTMIITTDWGMFYYAGLFGSRAKSVLFEWGLDDVSRIRYLQNLAKEHGRKIVVLYSSGETSINVPLVKWLMRLEPCAATPHNEDWVMLTEPDDEIRETCARYAAAESHPSFARRLLLQASVTR